MGITEYQLSEKINYLIKINQSKKFALCIHICCPTKLQNVQYKPNVRRKKRIKELSGRTLNILWKMKHKNVTVDENGSDVVCGALHQMKMVCRFKGFDISIIADLIPTQLLNGRLSACKCIHESTAFREKQVDGCKLRLETSLRISNELRHMVWTQTINLHKSNI